MDFQFLQNIGNNYTVPVFMGNKVKNKFLTLVMLNMFMYFILPQLLSC